MGGLFGGFMLSSKVRVIWFGSIGFLGERDRVGEAKLGELIV